MLVVGFKAERTVGEVLSIIMPTISGLDVSIAVPVMQNLTVRYVKTL
jgi:hypothetical protein